ncbi:hypothetical protein L1887_15839 [Cichorium endivia]|nr:hypothetical protein L1887_15839 [Cichorium endivia]
MGPTLETGPTINVPTTTPTKKFDCFDGLLPHGCFGLFPCPPIVHSAGLIKMNYNLGGSLGKRRRINEAVPSFWHGQIPSMPCLNNVDAHNVFSTLPIPPSTYPRVGSEENKSIDLNRDNNDACGEDRGSEASSFSQEVAKTIEIRKELGFQIESNDPILREKMG